MGIKKKALLRGVVLSCVFCCMGKSVASRVKLYSLVESACNDSNLDGIFTSNKAYRI